MPGQVLQRLRPVTRREFRRVIDDRLVDDDRPAVEARARGTTAKNQLAKKL